MVAATEQEKIMESENHRLEKTSKIIKSNHPPNTTMPTRTYPESATSTRFFNTSREGDSTSFQVVVESKKVPPQPPLLQTKQPQFPQLLLIRLALQTLHQLRCPSLDTASSNWDAPVLGCSNLSLHDT